MITEKLRGTVRIKTNLRLLVYENGALIDEQNIHNEWGIAGLNQIRDFLAGEAPGHISHIAWLDASGNEWTRDVVTQYVTTTDATLLIRQFLPSASAANGHTIAKIRAYDAVTGGVMFAEATFASSVAKTSSIQITAEWTHVFSDDGV
jgi:hypothetical protein